MVKASASGAEDPGFESSLRRDFFGSSHTNDLKIGTPVVILPEAPGVIGSALGLVGPVSVYCDLVRWKVLDWQLLSQCGSTCNCVSRYVPEIHSPVAGTLSNQQTNSGTDLFSLRCCHTELEAAHHTGHFTQPYCND